MKTVFDNRQVCHVWAQQSQAEGRSNNGNLFFEGKTIYSYGRHFPMGHFASDEIVLLNDDSYSMSTGKQQGYVRHAVNHKTCFYISTNALKAFLNSWENRDAFIGQLSRDCESAYFKALDNAAKRKKPELKERDLSGALSSIHNAIALLNALTLDVPARLYELDKSLSEDTEALLSKHKAAIDLLKQKTIDEEKAREVIAAQAAILWAVNKSDEFTPDQSLAFRHSKNIYMRIEGDEIVTSRGARFPVEHGVKAFKLIRMIREKKGFYSKSGHSIHLGNFTIDTVDKNGDVKAGCHFVKWSEIERLATELKIYP